MAGPDKPIIHGVDHLPEGPDPIPGLSIGGGIEFETDPQAGDWLYVETTDSPASGFGIELNASDGVWAHSTGGSTYEGDAGLTLRSSGGNISLPAASGTISAVAGSQFNATAGSTMTLDSVQLMTLESYKDTSYATAALLLRAAAGTLRMECEHLYMQLGTGADLGHIAYSDAGSGGLGFDAYALSMNSSGGTLRIIGSSGSYVEIDVASGVFYVSQLGTKLFQVDADGDLHGLTGKALTFDL